MRLTRAKLATHRPTPLTACALLLCNLGTLGCFGGDGEQSASRQLANLYLDTQALCEKQRGCEVADPYYCEPGIWTHDEIEEALAPLRDEAISACTTATRWRLGAVLL